MSLFRGEKPKVTLLFKEILGEIVEQQPDLMIGLAIELAAEQAGLSLPDIEALAERLMTENPKPAATSKTPSSNSNGFAAKYVAWLETLCSDQLCLWLADYDPIRAHTLYCDTEIDLVKALIDLKTAETWQNQRIAFEACLFGAGGELKGQNSVLHEVDMANASSVDAMVDAMKKLGL